MFKGDIELSAAKTKSENKKNYIVSSNHIDKIEKKYGLSNSLNKSSQEDLKEKNLVSVHITENEAEELEMKSNIQYIEEDMIVKASNSENSFHKKREKKIHKNNSKIEWNMQMIRHTKRIKKTHNKIKIAVLDSGVDYGNDIDLAESISLVPGEEEMSPLFIDGTGHGKSVAGLIAPGELVRSTGVLGDQLVASGTSLAAPQVAGLASLIWEKDISVSANFVRELIKESANRYGIKEKYGYGLIDVEFAMNNYNLFKHNYDKDSSNEIPENQEKIICYDDTGCVAGSWSSSVHGEFIPSENKNVKKGARFNDKEIHKEGNFSDNKPMWRYAGMRHNPWWHGYWKKIKQNLVKDYDVNYVASYIYLTKLANNISNYKNISRPSTLPSMVENEIKSDISYIPWSSSDALNKSNPTNGENYPISHDGKYPYADTITYNVAGSSAATPFRNVHCSTK